MTTPIALPVTPDLDPAVLDLVQTVSTLNEVSVTPEYLIIPLAAITSAATRLQSYLEGVTGETLALPVVQSALWDWLVMELDETVATVDKLATVPDAAGDLMSYLEAARFLSTRQPVAVP